MNNRAAISGFKSGSRCLDMGRNDAVAEHVQDGDDVLLDADIQQVGQQSVAVQLGDGALDFGARLAAPGSARYFCAGGDQFYVARCVSALSHPMVGDPL